MADRIIVDFQALGRISDRLHAAGRELDQAVSQLARMRVTRDAGAHVHIIGCGTTLRMTGMIVSADTVLEAVSSYKSAVENVSLHTSRLGTAVQTVSELFEGTEDSLSGKKLNAGENAPVGEGAEAAPLSLSEFRKLLLRHLLFHPGIGLIPGSLDGRVDFSAMTDLWGAELTDGHPGVTAWIGKASASVSGDRGSAEVNAYLGKAKAEVKAEGGIMKSTTKREFQNGEWDEKETLKFLYGELGATASVAALAADAKGTLGDDWFGVEGKAEGTAGSAKLEGKAGVSVGEDGVTAVAKGEAMVAAVEGKASGTINILGLEITGKVGGYAGAAGVGGKIGIEDNKFVLEGKVAALLGLSAGVEIGFNDTGWSNLKSDFVDFISFMRNLW